MADPPNEFKDAGPWRVNTYIDDVVRPTVTSFDLNMDTAVLTLYFTELIMPGTADVTGLTLQRANFTGREVEYAYTLTRSSTLVTTLPDTVMVIDIGKEDMDNIKVRNDP